MARSLQFSDYEFEKNGYTPVPPPSLNGGLYSGEPFQKGAPWANVRATPDSTYLINQNLKIGNPAFTPGSDLQYPATRKGNSYVKWTGLKRYEGTNANHGPYNIYCPSSEERPKSCDCSSICPGSTNPKLCNKTNCARNTFSQPPVGVSKSQFVP